MSVRDTLRALGDLAHFRREQIAPKVLAILAAVIDNMSAGELARRAVLLTTWGWQDTGWGVDTLVNIEHVSGTSNQYWGFPNGAARGQLQRNR